MQGMYQTKSKRWHKNKTQLENRNMEFMGQIGQNMGQNMGLMEIVDCMASVGTLYYAIHTGTNDW